MFASSHPRLLIITGKGGVGKTTVSLVAAERAAKEGKRVLLILLSETPWVSALFDQTAFGYTPTPVSQNLDIVCIDPRNAFREYISDYVGVNKLAEMALNRNIVTHFLDAVPGLNELLVLGKIYTLAKESLSKRGGPGSPYDHLIVDAPASGHGISLLQVPLVVKDAVKVGPLKTQTERMVAFFSDEKVCRLSIVTLLEDLPVQETIDLADQMEKSLYITLGPIVVNAALAPLPAFKGSFPDTPSFDAARFYEERLSIQTHYRKILKKRFNDTIELPFVPSTSLNRNAIRELSHEMI